MCALLKYFQSLNHIFTEYIIFFLYNKCGTQSSAGREILSFVIAVDRGLMSWWNPFLTEYFWIKQKKLYFNNKDKIVLHCMSEFTFEFEWAAVLQVLLEQKPTIIPSRASKNSTFCISWRWWNFITVYRCLFLCSSQALSCFITTLPYYSWELWTLSSPPRKKWICCSPRDLRMKP